MKAILENVKIDYIWHGWIGISALPNGKKVIVKGWVLPGSIVNLKIVKNKADYIEAHVITTKSYDKNFVDGEIFCPHFYIQNPKFWELKPYKIGCWGCKWQMMSYETQLKIKQTLVEEAFGKITKDRKISFLPIIWSPLTRGYRNKIEFSFWVFKKISEDYKKNCRKFEQKFVDDLEKFEINNEWWCWFHKQGEFAKVVDVESCGLISEKANQIFQQVKKMCFESGLPTYDQKTHQGFFRHLVIREGVNTGQMLVNLCVCESNLTKEQVKIWESLKQCFMDSSLRPEWQVSVFVITNNDGLADTVKSPLTETRVLWWDGFIYEDLNIYREQVMYESLGSSPDKSGSEWHRIKFRISPFSFFQTNTYWAERLFWTAFDMLGGFEGNILDLYCGTGSIGLSLLKMMQEKSGSLIGIEIVENAIIDARVNAKLNGLENQSSFFASPAEKFLEKFPEMEAEIGNLGVVIIDPPREWLHKNVIEWICKLKEKSDFKLLYISCNCVTMARDVELFVENGFEIGKIQPLDLFPHTHHCECIGILK